MPADDEVAHKWLADRLAELDRGAVEALLEAAREVEAGAAQRHAIDRASNYFTVNRDRMRYSRFREMGIFVGSGAVEVGCRAVTAQRMKLSGMRWRVHGAAAIVSLRCQEASRRWDEIWTWLTHQTEVA